MAAIDFTRVVASVVVGELAETRKISVLLEPLASITAETKLTDGGLGADSLELMRLAGAINELFHLHETTAGDYLLQHRTVGGWARIVSAAWELGPARLTFRTSGSSGEPKRCVHEFSWLQREVREHARRFAGVKRILAAVPSHHIYGFIFTVLLPPELGCEVLDVRSWSAERWAREGRGGDLIVASPPFWDYVSRSLASFPSGSRGVTSTAPCPDALFTRLRDQGLDLTEIYGSSELAGIGGRTRPDTPFELLPFWERAGEDLMRTEGDSRVPLAVPDRLEWRDARTFSLGGRRDGAVQVGGTNVFPERIAQRIASHPAVRECSVRLMRAEEGDRLKAFIVWRDESAVHSAAEELRGWLRKTFTASERPTALTFGSALPRNELGKLRDWDA